MRKTIFDDGFQSYLVEGAKVTGEPGIPVLADMNNVQIPKELVPFNKAKNKAEKRGYVHFFIHDKYFFSFMSNVKKYVELLKQYDGVITPDPTMCIDNSPCLLQTSTYFNRAIGFYLQRNGIPVMPNVRWTNESSYSYCFLGIPKNSIVAISTHGCCKSKKQKELFRNGLIKMLEILEPKAVIVHGCMPKAVFKNLNTDVEFHRFPSEFEQTHSKKEGD